MAITSNLVGPTGAELDNISTQGFMESLKFARKSKEDTINRTFEQFWKMSESSGLGPKAFAATPGGRAMLKAGLDPWGMKGDLVASAFANAPVDAAQLRKITDAMIYSGKFEQGLAELEKQAETQKGTEVARGGGVEPLPGQVIDNTQPPAPPPPPPQVPAQSDGPAPIRTSSSPVGIVDTRIVRPQPLAVNEGLPPGIQSVTLPQGSMTTRDKIMTASTLPSLGPKFKEELERYTKLFSTGYTEQELEKMAEQYGETRNYSAARAAYAALDKIRADKAGGTPAKQGEAGTAQVQAQAPAQSPKLAPVDGLKDTPEDFRKWLLANQANGVKYGKPVNPQGTADLRQLDPESYQQYLNLLGQKSQTAQAPAQASQEPVREPRGPKVLAEYEVDGKTYNVSDQDGNFRDESGNVVNDRRVIAELQAKEIAKDRKQIVDQRRQEALQTLIADKVGIPSTAPSPATKGETRTREEIIADKKEDAKITKAGEQAVAIIRKEGRTLTVKDPDKEGSPTKGYDRGFLSEIGYAAQKMQDADPDVSYMDETFKLMREEPRLAQRKIKEEVERIKSETNLNNANADYIRSGLKGASNALAQKSTQFKETLDLLEKSPGVIALNATLKQISEGGKDGKMTPKAIQEAQRQAIAVAMENSADVRQYNAINAALLAMVTGNEGLSFTEFVVKGNAGVLGFGKTPDRTVQGYALPGLGTVNPVNSGRGQPQLGTGSGAALGAKLGGD